LPSFSSASSNHQKLSARRLCATLLRRLRASADGQSLVEFALTLPILLLVVTGLMMFGIAINNYLELTDAVNVGARAVSIARGATSDPCSTASTAVINGAPLLKSANLSFKLTLNGNVYTGTSCSSGSTTTGVGIDVGRAYTLHRQLQAATDASALAGAAALPDSSATTTAANYSAGTGDSNTRGSLNGATMVSGYPKAVCLTTLQNQGMACASPSNANAMVVKEQITLNLVFMRLLGLKTITVGASSTAAMHGASPTPYNVAIVLDTTLSMSSYDSDCSMTQMACALQGVQVLLKALSPCAASYSTCSVTSGVAKDPVDQVALFTFPNVTTGTVSVDTNCTNSMPSSYGSQRYNYSSSGGYYYSMPGQTAYPYLPQATAFTFPTAGASSYSPSGATYQVTKFLSDYRNSDTASSLNSNSDLVQAAGGASNCGGMQPPNYAGNYGTYYAGAIYAAQAALTAQQKLYPGSQNVMIILSDGDANAPQTLNGVTVMPSPANSSGNYPSYKSECVQGYYAANAATAAGTRVYTVAYGSLTSGCSTDPSTYSGVAVNPCNVMLYMASAPQYFYSDYKQSGSGSTCYSSAQSVTSLSGIFTSIAGDMTVARLIPDNTT
jgi:Flp pilus assembly protein TadG